MIDVFFCGIGIDGDAMCAHEVVYEPGFAGQLERDSVGGQGRHVTIDAIGGEAHRLNGRKGTGVPATPTTPTTPTIAVVTGNASLRINLHFPMFVDVRVVAGGAIQLIGHPEAFAGREQTVLVAMHIERSRSRRIVICRGKIVEGIARPEAERGHLLVPESRVTERAGVEAPLAGELPGVDDIPGGTFGGVCGLPGDMLRGGPVATFAIDAIENAGAVEHGAQALQFSRFCIGAMAFHTLSMHLLAEISEIVRVSGTVAPAVERDKVRNGQLE